MKYLKCIPEKCKFKAIISRIIGGPRKGDVNCVRFSWVLYFGIGLSLTIKVTATFLSGPFQSGWEFTFILLHEAFGGLYEQVVYLLLAGRPPNV